MDTQNQQHEGSWGSSSMVSHRSSHAAQRGSTSDAASATQNSFLLAIAARIQQQQEDQNPG